jgi:ubiquinone/menaquinone biosynthesis C-methylase UbiE
MHEQTVVQEFTRQAETFNRAAVANAPGLLQALIDLAAPAAAERWLEAACGPGIIARALAPHVATVLGVDATPAMVELARREAAGMGNLEFETGDATALALPDDSFDGAVARFALHHIPAPLRAVCELARVVRPGGKVILADHVADEDGDARAWAQEMERLRDPSHWASLTVGRLRELGRAARLELDAEHILPLHLDFDDWLARGSPGAGAAALVEQVLADRPQGSECFHVTHQEDGSRRLELRLWLARWITCG